jgi:uncharacterized membrane-anchored protein YhcB (DUF1043 family)
MEKFIVVMPSTKILTAGVLLGIGLVVGIKIGSALLKMAAPRFSKLQTESRYR